MQSVFKSTKKDTKAELCNLNGLLCQCSERLKRVFTNTVLWTPKNADLKTTAIDYQENNLGIPLRVGDFMGL